MPKPTPLSWDAWTQAATFTPTQALVELAQTSKAMREVVLPILDARFFEALARSRNPSKLIDPAVESPRSDGRPQTIGDASSGDGGSETEFDVETGLALRSERDRSNFLSALAPSANAADTARMVENALLMQDENSRCDLLNALAPRAATEDIARMVDNALLMLDEGNRSSLLIALAPRATPEHIGQMIGNAFEMETEGNRSNLLIALAPRAAPAHIEQMVGHAFEMATEDNRSNLLTALGPRAAPEHIEQMIGDALAMRSPAAKSLALRGIFIALDPRNQGYLTGRLVTQHAAAFADRDDATRAVIAFCWARVPTTTTGIQAAKAIAARIQDGTLRERLDRIMERVGPEVPGRGSSAPGSAAGSRASSRCPSM